MTVTRSAIAGDGKLSTTEAYLERLQAEGKQRVIVKFKDEIDPGIVQRYCRVKRALKIINAAVC